MAVFKQCVSAAALVFLCTGALASPTDWYVDASNPGCPGVGTLSNPFCVVQDAIVAASNGDVVYVFPGDYPGIDYLGKAILVKSTDGPDLTRLGEPSGSSMNWSCVTFASGEGPGSELDGFTLSGGTGTIVWPVFWEAFGGGIYCQAASPVVRGCIVEDNFIMASSGGNAYGGGMYATGNPVVIDCVFRNNTAYATDLGQALGGGIYGDALLYNCLIEGNEVFSWWHAPEPSGGGGAALCTVVEGCIVRDNEVWIHENDEALAGQILQGGGGGLFRCGSVRGCLIEGNTLWVKSPTLWNHFSFAWGGGAAECTELVDCQILSNLVTTDGGSPDVTLRGGGIADSNATDCALVGNDVRDPVIFANSFAGGASGGSLLRCLIADNNAHNQGACDVGALRRCTIVRNFSAVGGCVAAATIDSTIVWGNFPGQIEGTPAAITYSDIQDALWPGIGNISSDPGFWDSWSLDCHLRHDSPCIDAGNPAYPPDPNGSRVEMGYLAFDAGYCTDPVTYCTASTTSGGCTPAIAWSGSPSLSSGPQLRITADEVPNQVLGLLFYGKQGPAQTPFHAGWLCVVPPVVRTSVLHSGGSPSGSDCTGSFAFNFDGYVLSGLDPELVAGAQVGCQFWFRDPPSFFSSALTDAVRFVLCQ